MLASLAASHKRIGMENTVMMIGPCDIRFKLSGRKPPGDQGDWVLYDVYRDNEYVGLVANTRLHEHRKYELWMPLEGDSNSLNVIMNRDDAASSFVSHPPSYPISSPWLRLAACLMAKLKKVRGKVASR